MPRIKKVLFICTGNSIRSQMAEGLLRALGNDRWDAASAGVLPSYVHPLAVRVMSELGIDISHQTSKSVERFLGQTFHHIITLCDYAAVSCPAIPGQGRRSHWPIDDPISAEGTVEERLVAFRKARDEIRKKIMDFVQAESD
jgi:arsenate reductase